MPAVKLDRAEADRTISDVTSMNQQIQTKLKNIEAEQMQMLQANWHGGSAATYGKYSQAQQEEFTRITTTLDQVVQTATEHINSVVSQDNG
jgi:uncharacterized protein YukE